MNIFDCTTFFNERLMMDLRFNILNDHVSKFVVVESTFSHSGEKKKLNFNIDDYPKFKDKIIYIPIDKEPYGLVKGEELIKTHLTKNIDRTGETVVSVSQGNDSFFTTYSIDSCGKYEINADLPNFKFSIDGVPEEWFIESSFNAFLQTREQVGILAVNFVNSYLVDELEDSALEQLIASTQDQLASISNEYESE